MQTSASILSEVWLAAITGFEFCITQDEGVYQPIAFSWEIRSLFLASVSPPVDSNPGLIRL